MMNDLLNIYTFNNYYILLIEWVEISNRIFYFLPDSYVTLQKKTASERVVKSEILSKANKCKKSNKNRYTLNKSNN